MALLEETGKLIPQLSDSYYEAGTSTEGAFLPIPTPYTEINTEERIGDLIALPVSGFTKGARVVTDGRYTSNTDTVVDRSGFELPGYALHKTSRVITLIDQTRVAVGAVIQ